MCHAHVYLILVRTILGLTYTYKKYTNIILPDYKSLHTTSKKEKRGGYSDQIQVNLCPTYDICLDSLLYTVYAYWLPFCVFSLIVAGFGVSDDQYYFCCIFGVLYCNCTYEFLYPIRVAKFVE